MPMLEELQIQNFALIDRLTVRFEPGFNILTGETGAGKSILIGALSLLLGARVDRSVIRDGEDECIVSAIISLSQGSGAHTWLHEHGISTEDNRIIIRRSVRKQKRGNIYVQSIPVVRSELEELSTLLINLHGQHEYHQLNSPDRHRQLLDGFGALTETTAKVKELHTNLTTLQNRFNTLEARNRDHGYQLELLRHAVEEIEKVNIQEGEENDLAQEIRKLTQHEKLSNILQDTTRLLSEHDGGSLALLRKARTLLEQALAIDSEMVSYSQKLDSVFFELQEITQGISEAHHSMRFSNDRLNSLQGRYDAIMTLQSKYGENVAKVRAYLAEAKAQIEELTSWKSNRSRLEGEIAQRQKEILLLAKALSAKRTHYATQLQESVTKVVRTLGMPNAQFEVLVAQRVAQSGAPLCGASGIDTVAFNISANLGETPRKLQQVASGGELSRIMLAITTILARSEEITTMIFDEVDSGIGGKVALSVGEHLANLAKNRQVICISHTASIASVATTHLLVEKQTQSNRTVTKVRKIQAQEREIEISRMLAGSSEDALSRQHAAELLGANRAS